MPSILKEGDVMPMDTQEMLLEIKENLVELRTELKNIMQSVDLKLIPLEDKIKVANHRIEDLEKQNTWLWRCVGGALIGVIISSLM